MEILWSSDLSYDGFDSLIWTTWQHVALCERILSHNAWRRVSVIVKVTNIDPHSVENIRWSYFELYASIRLFCLSTIHVIK
jgi:hypothetical protein